MKKKLCRKVRKGQAGLVTLAPTIAEGAGTSVLALNPIGLGAALGLGANTLYRMAGGPNITDMIYNYFTKPVQQQSQIVLSPEQISQPVMITPEQLALMEEMFGPIQDSYDWRGTLGGKVVGSLERGIGRVRRKLAGETTNTASDDNTTTATSDQTTAQSTPQPTRQPSNKEPEKPRNWKKPILWTAGTIAGVTSKPVRNYIWPGVQNVYNWGWSNDPTYHNIPSHVDSEEDLWYNAGTGWIGGTEYIKGVPVESKYQNSQQNKEQSDTTNINTTSPNTNSALTARQRLINQGKL